MSRPVAGCALARVHVYARDGSTSRGILNGGNATTGGTADLRWSWSKSIDGSSCSFTASALDPAMVSNPSMLEDSLGIVELNVGGVWTAVGTPYVLSPGSGTAIGAGEGAAYEFSPSGVGAAVGLCAEWLVLHRGGVINRRGPADRYLGWQSAEFVDASWDVPDEVDPATDLIITDPKYGEPSGWPTAAAAATWVYRDPVHGDTGGLSLFRFGSFTVATARKYRIGFSCDEECTVYLDGPGWGGVFASSSDQETGYMNYNREGEVLEAGTYYVAAEMTTVNSAGGDGFDAIRLFVATVDDKDRVDTVVLTSNASDTLVHRQAKTDVRPGFTPDEVLEILRDENSTWGIPSADLLTVVATDTMPDGEERVWPAVLTTVAQVLADLEIDVHADVDTSWNLNVTADPTVDVSATLGLVAGASTPSASMNVEGLGWSSDGTIGTRAGILTNDGFAEYIDTAAEATIAARAIPLDSGASGSIAKGVLYAADAVAQSVKVRRNYHADPAGITGNVPFVNVKPCYRIAALNYLKAAEDQIVLSITGTNQTTRASFSYELGTP